MPNKPVTFHGKKTLKDRLLREAKAIREAGNFLNPWSRSNPKHKVNLVSWLSDNPIRTLAYKDASSKTGIDQEVLLTCMMAYGRLYENYDSIPQALITCCKVGIDTSQCWDKLALWLLVDGKRSLLKQCSSEVTQQSILQVSRLYRENCTDKKIWQSLEDVCRQEARKLKFFFDDYLDSGELAPISTINPEFCALWGAARAAARKGRETFSIEWASLILSAWFRTEEELCLMDRRKIDLPYTGIRRHIAATVRQEMAGELLDALFSILEKEQVTGA